MSISTKQGDSGLTQLIGGGRVSKGDARIEAYGHIDELVSTLGLARSLCPRKEIEKQTASIQRELFQMSASIANTGKRKPGASEGITAEKVEGLTAEVRRLESIAGLLTDWALPGAQTAAASYDVARTVCRRAERQLARLQEAGHTVEPQVLAYLNRLSDLLWLYARALEKDAGIDASLRDGEHPGPPWSRAW